MPPKGWRKYDARSEIVDTLPAVQIAPLHTSHVRIYVPVPTDPELQAVAVCLEALRPLTEGGRVRTLRYVAERAGIGLDVLKTRQLGALAMPDTSTP